MLTSLHIKNFRGFQDLTIQPLARVNLVAGKNNVGKTGVLEAIYLLTADNSEFSKLQAIFRASSNNQIDDFDGFWAWLPYKKDPKNLIEITGYETEESYYQVKQTLSDSSINRDTLNFERLANQEVIGKATVAKGMSPNVSFPQRMKISTFSTQYSLPHEDADIFNTLVIKKKKHELINFLQKVDPLIRGLEYLKVSNYPQVYAEYGDLNELIPLTQLGQGVSRLFRFYAEMLLAESKIILIDEIENGIHHSALSLIWKGLAEIARQEDSQIFATTHSWECIQAAHQVFSAATPYDFALHRLQRVRGDIQAVTHDQEMIKVATKTELEIR